MLILKRTGTGGSFVATLALVALLAARGGAPSVQGTLHRWYATRRPQPLLHLSRPKPP